VSARALRALLGPACVVALLAAAPRAAAAAWQPDTKAAIAYIHTRAGRISFAVRTERHVWGYHRTDAVNSLSVVKALLLVAYLDDPRVRRRPLTPADHRLVDPMIRRSDNDAATKVLAYVGARRVQQTATRVGMRRFRLDPLVWGGSRIDASDQTRFFLHLDAHVVARHRATAMRLLGAIVPEQRWGVGKVRPDGWRLYFKGGWGDGENIPDHQVALLTFGTRRVAVAVLSTGNPSNAYGNETLRGVFARLLRGLAARSVLTPL
jgi:hypothetical protein